MPIRSNRAHVVKVYRGPPDLDPGAELTVAVIIAAWKAERWLGECLESVAAQRLPRGVTVDVRIGVDACESTAAYLDATQRSYWWSSTNVGPYVIRNSLIERARADAYAIFDADDRMRPRYLSKLLKAALPDRIAGAARYTIDSKGRTLNGNRTAPYQHGVCVIPHQVWQRLGGYQGWRIAADTELTLRAKHHGIEVRKLSDGLYERRKHGASLTQHPDTKMGSAVRRALSNAGRRQIMSGGPLQVVPEQVELTRREAGWQNTP